MKDLILEALRESVKRYPEVVQHLQGDAKWMAQVFAYKVGEAPDDDVRRKDERELSLLLTDFFDKQQERIIREIKKEFDTKSVFDNSFWQNEASALWNKVAGKVTDVILNGFQGAINILPERISSRINLAMARSELVKQAMKYRNEWISTINKNTMQGIWKTIEQWKQTGDPIGNLVDLIKNMGFSESRAKMIATTEVTRLNALAHEIAYKESGVVRTFRWMTANDELVCDECGANNGQEFPLESLHELIPAHPNCRCHDEAIIDERHEGNTVPNNNFGNY